VTSGPYRLVRHPIYFGFLLAGVGTAVTLSWTWLIAVALVEVYFVYSATVEERNLTEQFPVAYPEYRRSTKMLVHTSSRQRLAFLGQRRMFLLQGPIIGRSSSWRARLGTKKDARKIGRKLFPVHRKATVWLSAASKVLVRLEFRPLRTCRV